MKLREWQMAKQGLAQKKATKKTLVHGAAAKKALVHEDATEKTFVHGVAVILKTSSSCNDTRVEIQARCKLADGSEKTIGIVGLMSNRTTKFAEIDRAIIATCNENCGITKAMFVCK